MGERHHFFTKTISAYQRHPALKNCGRKVQISDGRYGCSKFLNFVLKFPKWGIGSQFFFIFEGKFSSKTFLTG